MEHKSGRRTTARMSNPVAELLTRWHRESRQSLKAIGEKGKAIGEKWTVSPQSLSTYQTGLRLPPKEALPTLAECYGGKPGMGEELERAYALAVPKVLEGPLTDQ